MTGDQVLEFFAHHTAALLGARAMNDHGQSVNGFRVHENRQLDEIGLLITGDVIVEARVAPGDRFQPVVKIEHYLVQRQIIDEHGAGTGVGELLLAAPPVLAEFEHHAQMLVRHKDGRFDPWFLHGPDLHGIGHVGGIVKLDFPTVDQGETVDDGRCGGDDVDIELALDALADDVEMQEAKKSATKSETQSGGSFHFEGKACVVEAELAHGLAQILKTRCIDGEEAGEDHRLGGLEAGKRLCRLVAIVGHGVAHSRVSHLLDRGGEEADLPRAERRYHLLLGAENADALHEVGRVGEHELYLHALFQFAIDDADQNDDTEIRIVPAIDQQGFQG